VSENEQKAALPADVEASSSERAPRARRAPEPGQTRTSRIEAVKAEVEDAAALRSKMIRAMRRKLETEARGNPAPGENQPDTVAMFDELLEPVDSAAGDWPASPTSSRPAERAAPLARALSVPRRPLPPAPGESEVWDEAVQSAERVERALARLSEALAREENAALGGGRSALAGAARYRVLKVATVFGASFAIGISSLVLAYDWRSGTRFESRLMTLARDLWPSKAEVSGNAPPKIQIPAVKKAPAAKKETAVAKREPAPTKSIAIVKLEALDARGKAATGIPLRIKAVSTSTEPIDLRVAGLPGDAELSAGRRQGDGSWLLQPGQEKGVTLEVPTEASGSLMLTVEAVERSTGELAAPPREIRVKIDPGQIIVEPAASNITPVSTRVEGAVALPPPASALAGLPVAENDEIAAIEEAAEAPAMAIGIDDPARPLMARGDALMEIGDVVSARSFYDRAFDLGNVRAALSIARTYDPLVLASLKVQGLRADPAKALEWYRKAERGEPEVAQAIGALEQFLKE
jgi:tetratricopeptide (TPR) repeat protein